MADTSAGTYTLPSAVDLWLAPVDEDSPAGPDLEYDPDFLELLQATGKPATQFGPAEPPNWPRIRELAESLLGRTRDLRIALWWGRAAVSLEGFAAAPAGIALIHGLLDRFWDTLHPVLDPDDPTFQARLSVIGALDKQDSLLGDVRGAPLSADRQLGGLRARDVEVALGKLAPRQDEAAHTPGQISGMLTAVPEAAEALRAQTAAGAEFLAQVQSLMMERFRPDLLVDLAAMRGIFSGLHTLLPPPAEAAEQPGVEAGPADAPAAPSGRKAGGVHSVDTRQDAIRAIELVCAYLERNEPTNPAQLLLHRAARVIDKNFLQLVRELAPDAMKDVAKIMGIDPATIADSN